MEEYRNMFRRTLDFQGRTGVQEFWAAAFYSFLALCVFGAVLGAIKLPGLMLAPLAAHTVPFIALCCRRFEDLGRDRLLVLAIIFIPLLGFLLLLPLLTSPASLPGGEKMRNLNIRPYTHQDWDAIEAIHDSARRRELALAGLSDAFLPLREAAPAEGLFDYSILVAEAAGSVVGFVAYSEDELAWLYVDPAVMRRGVGRALAERALALQPGIRWVELLEGNYPAQDLYRSLGFVPRKTVSGRMPGNETFMVRAKRMERKVYTMRQPSQS